MAIRGHGRLMTYAELTQEARSRRRGPGPEELDTDAVVGMIDTRRRATACPSNKSHGPNALASDAFACAPEQMARLYDPLGVEATSTGEVSLSWQGADNAMLIENRLANHQAMTNQRSVALADQEPKLYGGELQTRMVGHLEHSVVETQWGDGF